MYIGQIALSSMSTGQFHYKDQTKSMLEFHIYGETEEEVRKKTLQVLSEIKAVASMDYSEEYREEFSKIPSILQSKISRKAYSFNLPFDPYEPLAGGSWELKKVDEWVVIVQ